MTDHIAMILRKQRWPTGLTPRRVAVLVALASLLVLLAAARTTTYATLRERAFDVVLRLATRADVTPPIVVDIDRAALVAHGAWPWSRERMATLVDAIAAAKPKAIALDILLDGDDARSPAALAKRLAAATGKAEFAAAAKTLPDGDVLLADALDKVPAVLGIALDHVDRQQLATLRAVGAVGQVNATLFWQDQSFIAPPQILLDASAGAGLIAMAGDEDGTVRRVPMFAIAGPTPVPGLALELVRAADGVPLLQMIAEPLGVAVGNRLLPLNADGMLRLHPDLPLKAFDSIIAAGRVLASPADAAAALKDRVVIIGSSAPEAGGLRPGSGGDLLPSFAFEAAAYRQLAAGIVPRRLAAIERAEPLLAALATAGGAAAALWLSPWLALVATLGGIVTWLVIAVVGYAGPSWLIDPLLVSAALMLGFLCAALVMAADTRRREARIRQRFEQHLSPDVIAALIDDPAALRLEGRVRNITALFTDVEGFTSMTNRATPEQLISVLDDYFDGVSRIVIDHGGMIDKIVGDAVHAIFNAPLDLADHPARAFACAEAVVAYSEAFQRTPLAAALRFGRTRVGVETGSAIVGDVGGRRKLDYTAHGNAVNAAARLEAANKQLATAIAIGPGAAASLADGTVRPVGRMVLRGQDGDVTVYSTWPPTYTTADRAAYLHAMATREHDGAAAGAAIAALMAAHPQDGVLARLAHDTPLAATSS